jgi:hypothetical protein
MFQYEPEDDHWKVESCSRLAYYSYKLVFLTTVYLLLFIPHHNWIDKPKICNVCKFGNRKNLFRDLYMEFYLEIYVEIVTVRPVPISLLRNEE